MLRLPAELVQHWEELHKVLKLGAAVTALGPMNNGSSILNKLRANEDKS
jgi:4-carboxymuconolactone decarboxylase